MKKEAIESSLKQAMAAVFKIAAESINEESSVFNTDNWDSIRHMNLFICLEEEFGVEFEEEEMSDLVNFRLISRSIEEKLGGI